MLKGMRAVLLCTSLLLLQFISTNTFGMTGKEYLAECSLQRLEKLDSKDERYGLAVTFCTTLIRGIIAGHIDTASFYEKPRLICIPPEQTFIQITGHVVGGLETEKTYLDQSIAGLAIVYLSRVYPCKKTP